MHEYRYRYGDKPLEGYTIQRAAGRGGFGEVYYAVSDSGRQVALKTVQNHEQIELRGIKQCMNLKSPHLVSIFDVKHNAQGQPFVVMEFVSGVSLRDLLDESPGGLGVQKTAFFLREIAKGLSHLHECGIVHRDLKPSNIFYENGYAKIGDYGLTKAISNNHRSEQTVTVGTVHYMAPEIGEGKYDFGIDIYALGILLYEMLTGNVPFFGASPAEVLMKHLSKDPDMTGIDATFTRVIKKALAKDPNERYKTVQEMVEDVFGTEHIRQSVSQFSPESLSIIADHVAAKAKAAQQQEQNKAQTAPPTPEGAGENLSSLGENIGRRLGQAGDRLAEKIARAGSGTKAQSSEQIQDSIGRVQRYILGAITIFVMAASAGILTQREKNGFGVFFLVCGIVTGLSLMRWHFIRDAEPGHWRNWFAGGLGIFVGIMVSAGAFHANPQSLVIPLVPLCFVDWWKLTRPNRKERVVWGGAIGIGLLGFFLAGLFQGFPIATAGAIIGTIVVMQIISPFGAAVPAAAQATGRRVNRIQQECQTRWQTFVSRHKERSQARPVQAPEAAPQTPSGSPTKRLVPGGLRAMFMVAMIITLGTWIYAFIALTSMNLARDEAAIAMSFGFCGLLTFFFCLFWSGKRTYKSWYRFLVKPAAQLFLLNVVITAACCLTNMHLGGDEEAIALFFMIFPGVLFLVVSFIPSRVVEEMTGLTPPEDLSASRSVTTLSPKSRLGALLFCLIPWPFCLCGLHRFAVGRFKTGFLWFFTVGLFGIGQLIDFVLILTGGFRDGQGRLVLDWNPTVPIPPAQPSPNRPKDNDSPAAPPIPHASPKKELAVQAAAAPRPPVSSSGGSTSVWKAVDEFNPVGRLLSGLGFVLLLVAILGGLIFALHVPWFISGGFPDPSLSEELEELFGYAEWPNLVETLGAVLCVLIGIVAVTLIIIGRRRAGALHMTRAIIGVAIILIAFMFFAQMIPSHFFKAPEYSLDSRRQPQRDAFQQMLTDKETGRAVGYLVDHLYENMAVLGTSMMIVATVTLAWPPRRQNKPLPAIQAQTV